MAFRPGYGNDQFLNPGIGFLGIKFNIGAGTQYGWVRVNMVGAPDNAYTIVDYAYADAGDTIKAGQTAVPEPGLLGMLALGAVGVSFWRRKRSEAA